MFDSQVQVIKVTDITSGNTHSFATSQINIKESQILKENPVLKTIQNNQMQLQAQQQQSLSKRVSMQMFK